MRLRTMLPADWPQVAQLIHDSTNAWYQSNRNLSIFGAGIESCLLFCQVYEDLDPGCCVVAEDESAGQIMGSCFYHPRDTHVSLGIMNVHPGHFGKHVASKLLAFITDLADRAGKPLRLVSSAMNLDSFSLYNRAGFTPRAVFQDMLIPVPAEGLPGSCAGQDRVRDATLDDVAAMVELEQQVSHISRPNDYRYFIQNRLGIWRVSVLESGHGGIDGFLCSVNHPASNMLGPGVMRTETDAAALIRSELDHHRGRSPVFLVPSDRAQLVRQIYSWDGRNCEIHFCQVRGRFDGSDGVVMPTFMPETG